MTGHKGTRLVEATPGRQQDVRPVEANAVRPVEDSIYQREDVVSPTPESEVAAAVCYLLSFHQATLDPDGNLTAAFWPYDFEEYKPNPDTEKTLYRALGHLTAALLLMGKPLRINT